MAPEREPRLDLPEYETTISHKALVGILEEAVEAKRQLKKATGVIESPQHSFSPRGAGEFLTPFVTDLQHTDSMLEAMDRIAPILDGRSWGSIATEIAEHSQTLGVPQD